MNISIIFSIVVLSSSRIVRTLNSGSIGPKVFMLVLLLTICANAQFAFDFQSPRITPKEITGICFPTPTTGYACGKKGLILKTTDGGDNWIDLRNSGTADYFSLQFLDSLTGFIGSFNLYLKTTDGGNTWRQNTFQGDTANIKFSFLDKNNGWFCTLKNIYKTTNGGTNWTVLLTFNTPLLSSVKLYNNGLGYYATNREIYKTEDSGTTWVKIADIAANSRVSFYSERFISFFANQKLYFTNNAGVTWSAKSIPLDGNTIIGNNFFSNNQVCAYSSTGRIFTSADTGNSWSVFQGPRLLRLNSSATSNPYTWWVCGDSGVIYKSSNSGGDWSIQQDELKAINSITFSDSLTGHAVGNNGYYLRTTNGGKNWFKMPALTGSQLYNFNGVVFPTKDIGYCVGSTGVILKTKNAGRSWEWMNSGTTWKLSAAYFFDSTQGFAVGDYSMLLRTTNGGITWNVVNTPSFGDGVSINFANKDTGIVNGSTGSLVTVNAGASWTFLSTLNNRPVWTSFVNSKLGFGLFYYGIVLKTVNGGVSWAQVKDLGNGLLTAIAFKDASTGVIVGGEQILKTTNGGLSWQETTHPGYGQIRVMQRINNTYFIAGGNSMIFTAKDTAMFTDLKESVPQNSVHPLVQAFPNPFFASVNIKYNLQYAGFVSLKVYDALGREVCTLVEQVQQPGEHTSIFQGKDKAAGFYFYRLVCRKESFTGKMMLVK